MEKRKKEGRDFLSEAKHIQAELLESIQGINLDDKDKTTQRERINLIHKMRAGVNAAKYSGDRNVEITISSSNNIKELVEVAKKLSGVMEYFLTQTTYLTKKGDTNGAIDLIKNQAIFQDSISNHVKDLDAVVSKYLIDGVGRRGDVKAAQEADYIREVNEIKTAYVGGKKISEIATTSKLPIDKIESLCQGLRFEYLSSNKEEILKALSKSRDTQSVSKLYEVSNKQLRGILNSWAQTDAKAFKVLESFKVANQKPVAEKEKADKEEPVTA